MLAINGRRRGRDLGRGTLHPASSVIALGIRRSSATDCGYGM